MLINIVSNSLKFTSYGGISIEIYTESSRSFEEQQRSLCFKIKDTGEGIADLDQIDTSKLLYSVYKEQSNYLIKGVGLGLSVSTRIANSLKGSIDISSVKDDGTIVIVKVLDQDQNNSISNEWNINQQEDIKIYQTSQSYDSLFKRRDC